MWMNKINKSVILLQSFGNVNMNYNASLFMLGSHCRAICHERHNGQIVGDCGTSL